MEGANRTLEQCGIWFGNALARGDHCAVEQAEPRVFHLHLLDRGLRAVRQADHAHAGGPQFAEQCGHADGHIVESKRAMLQQQAQNPADRGTVLAGVVVENLAIRHTGGGARTAEFVAVRVMVIEEHVGDAGRVERAHHAMRAPVHEHVEIVEHDGGEIGLHTASVADNAVS